MTLTYYWSFINFKSDTLLFFKRENNHLLLILVYVDDIIVTDFRPQLINQVISNLQTNFALKDLAKLYYFLGIQVTYNSTELLLSQSKYIADLLVKVHMQDNTPCSAHMAFGVSLTQTD